MRNLWIAAALLAAAGATAAAPPALAQRLAKPADQVRLDPARIARALKAMVRGDRAVGVSALVWQGGRERFFAAEGLADREANRPMRRDTLVQVFSMTKPVTGVALMQLWEAGKFGLDDPVSRYIPAFADARVYAGNDPAGVPIYKPAARPMSVRDLMRHTAGISYGADKTPPDLLWKQADPLNLDHDLTRAAELMGPLPLKFEPGTRWSYSAAVDVQARLVEILSGETFADYVRAHIFQPLGMKDSGWKRDGTDLPRLASEYVAGADGVGLTRSNDADIQAMNFAGHPLTMGGAGIVAPIDDYMRFARMLLGGGTLDGVRILRPSTVRLMATDQLDPRVTDRLWLPSKGSVGFGLDFAVRLSRPKDAAENRGAVGEFFWDGRDSTLFWVDPANDLAAVFFVQKLPFDRALHHDIREAVYGADYLGPPGD
jgi:CubicO group peptidase (beta-lactamase class C family)